MSNTAQRADTVNDGLTLLQNENGLTFGTDALMLASYIEYKSGHALELGAGTGVISLLLLKREKIKRVTALEVQPSYTDLCRRNAERNGFSEAVNSVCIDLRDYNECADHSLVFTNPPYMKSNGGKRNVYDEKNIARHEIKGNILDFCKCAARSLKFGGAFYVVYRPDRLEDLLVSMRECGLEPKRMTFVYADTDSPPSIVLVEGKRGAHASMRVTPPLILYADKAHTEYTEDYHYICKTGMFPDKFRSINPSERKERTNAGKEPR